MVKVTYRLTSLSAAGDGRVQAFARDFPAMLASWEQQIAKALADARVKTI